MHDSVSASIRDNFSLSTWLAIAAICQGILVHLIPFHLAIIAPSILIILRLGQSLAVMGGLMDNNSLEGVHFGRWTSKIPSLEGVVSEEPSTERVTLLVLGARAHHPAGILAPDLMGVVGSMQQLLQELDKDARGWGFLGRTPSLVSSEAASRNTIFWLLYWESPEALHRFAASSLHPIVVKEYQSRAKASGYHIGIMHEVYDVPARHWETIYLNMLPVAMGSCSVARPDVNPQSTENAKTVGVLHPAQGPKWKSMMSRMGRTGSSLPRG